MERWRPCLVRWSLLDTLPQPFNGEMMVEFSRILSQAIVAVRFDLPESSGLIDPWLDVTLRIQQVGDGSGRLSFETWTCEFDIGWLQEFRWTGQDLSGPDNSDPTDLLGQLDNSMGEDEGAFLDALAGLRGGPLEIAPA